MQYVNKSGKLEKRCRIFDRQRDGHRHHFLPRSSSLVLGIFLRRFGRLPPELLSIIFSFLNSGDLYSALPKVTGHSVLSAHNEVF
jgi:hypothetical protein